MSKFIIAENATKAWWFFVIITAPIWIPVALVKIGWDIGCEIAYQFGRAAN